MSESDSSNGQPASRSIRTAAERVRIPTRFDEPARFSFSGIEGEFYPCWPRCDGAEITPPANGHARRETFAYRLGGQDGCVVEDVWRRGGIELARQVWTPGSDEASLAIRLRIRNLDRSRIRLEVLEPVRFEGNGAFRLGESPVGEWEVLCQRQEKNEAPVTRKLGDRSFETVLNEQGDVRGRKESGPLELSGDSFFLFRPGAGGGDCLLGFLGGRDAITEIRLETDGRREKLVTLGARCVLDGVELPEGGERFSEWVALSGGASGWKLADDHAERMAAHEHCELPPRRPPSVWCSWYHYGNEFTEADLHEELRGLKAREVPFDVVLIDDFRPRAWGDWLDCPLWPSGLEDAARSIREAGFRPGFWTAPFVVEPDSKLALANPRWILRRRDGEPVIFHGQRHNPDPEPDPDDPEADPTFRAIISEFHVLDPTYPGVEAFFEELYRRLADTMGFSYFKFDFLRAVTGDPEARFHDRSATRVQAYRRGLRAIRRGAGPRAYLSVCGGHYGGSVGLADSQRSGADVQGRWDHPPAAPKLKQNLLRTWMNRFWHTDPDALMLRRRPQPVAPTFAKRLSLGRFNDDEARTMAVNQYAGGGLVCATEHFADIDDDRLALYRHILPPLRSPGFPLDPFHPVAPTCVRNRVEPLCGSLAPWITLAVFNWEDDPVRREIGMDAIIGDALEGDRFLVFDFFAQTTLGVFDRADTLPAAEIRAHGARLWRLASWNPPQPVLAGTDRHFSGGGVEVAEWSPEANRVSVGVESPWREPVTVHVAFPGAPEPILRTARIGSGQRALVSAAGATAAAEMPP